MSQFSSHSADVLMWLDCGEHGRMELSRITPKSVVARAPRDIPPCYADLVVTVDGQQFLRRVRVPLGFSKGRMLTRIDHFEEAPF